MNIKAKSYRILPCRMSAAYFAVKTIDYGAGGVLRVPVKREDRRAAERQVRLWSRADRTAKRSTQPLPIIAGGGK